MQRAMLSISASCTIGDIFCQTLSSTETQYDVRRTVAFALSGLLVLGPTSYGILSSATALPGGIGTLEELLEVSTWLQLEQHDKPVIVANLFDYWEPLKDLLASTVAGGFVDQSTIDRIRIVDSVEQLMGELGLQVA